METEFGDGGVQSIFVSGVELMLSWGFDNLYTEQISALYQFYEKHILDDPLILYQDYPEKYADMSADALAIIDLVPKKRKNINNCNRPVKKIKCKLYD